MDLRYVWTYTDIISIGTAVKRELRSTVEYIN